MTIYHTIWLLEEFGEWYQTYNAYQMYVNTQRQQLMHAQMGFRQM